MKKTIKLIEISQPIGIFYSGKMKAVDLLKITDINRRNKLGEGIQRELSSKRVEEISKYCDDPDATFPTPIIISVQYTKELNLKSLKEIFDNENLYFKNNDLLNVFNEIYLLEYDDTMKFAEILDGQHRLEGIGKSNNKNMELPVVVMFDLTEEEKAYVFSTINSNQTKVDKSLIYDLFELSTSRGPYKTCHEIARSLNMSSNSPFYGKLKMLGKKSQDSEMLSQGTFVTYLVGLISNKPKQDMIDIKNRVALDDDSRFPLRKYFIFERDEIILKLIIDFFTAVQIVFKKEWESKKYILLKTTGYGAMLIVFKFLLKKGINENNLGVDFYVQNLTHGKKVLDKMGIELTSKYFPSNEQTQKKLANYFIDGINEDF